MSGIVGFALPNISQETGSKTLQAMSALLHHGVDYVVNTPFCHQAVYANRIHNGLIQPEAQPFEQSGIYVWLDGEFYNQLELWPIYNSEPISDPHLLLKLYQQDPAFGFLTQVDGLFAAVIYDTNCNEIHLITDRYGLRYLYWLPYRGGLVWASDVKAFLALSGFEANISEQAVAQFLNIGYLLEDNTWFDGVRLAEPGQVLTWHITDQQLRTQQYWWWNHIQPMSEPMTEADITEQLHHLFEAAIARRSREEAKVGVTLSGGLDSRAILAAMPPHGQPIQAITLGKKGCDDIKFAAQAAQVKGAKHHIADLNVDNWMTDRAGQVWYTDGQQNLLHMHGAIIGSQVRDIFSINLGGLAGDIILGGGYLKSKAHFETITADKKALIAQVMHTDGSLLQQFDQYVGLGKLDYYMLHNRLRRFTYAGAKSSRLVFEERAPFYDNALLEFVYSLPDHYRHQSNIYHQMLLRFYPAYFERIPWQSTGMPISWSKRRRRIYQKLNRQQQRWRRKLQRRVGLTYNPSHNVADYDVWLRQDPARSFFDEILSNPNALYKQYIPADTVTALLAEHLNSRRNHAEVLGRYMTLEIWLQQIFEKKYRPEPVTA